MQHQEYQYLNLLEKIMEEWKDREDRTWVGTRWIFWAQLRFNLEDEFPLLTTKKMFTRWIIHELVWFIRGDTNIKYLADNEVNIWNDRPYENYKNHMLSQWVKPENLLSKEEFIEKIKNLPKDDDFVKNWWDLGPVYWQQWRNFNKEGVDQLKNAIDTIKNNPYSRRIIVTAWNPLQVDSMLLPPCHALFQFYVDENRLCLQMYQRSADMFLGVPFNIASYSFLLLVVARITWYKPWDFIHTFGDAHIYKNHFEQVNLQLSRTPYPLPKAFINNKLKNIDKIKFEDFEIEWYQSHAAIKAPIAV